MSKAAAYSFPGNRAFKSPHAHQKVSLRSVELDTETKRKLVHVGNGLWTFALPFLPRIIAIFLVLVAFVFVFLLSRPKSPFGSVFQGTFAMMARHKDVEKQFLFGPSLYVVMVLLLVLFVDYRIAGAVFVILAFGDGFATIVGRRIGNHKLACGKSVEGSLAFFLTALPFGTIVFTLIDIFNTPEAGGSIVPLMLLLPPDLLSTLGIGVIGLIFSAVALILTFTELYLAKFLDDNVLIPVLGSALLFSLFSITLAVL